MNKVVAPVAGLCTEVRSGWRIADEDGVPSPSAARLVESSCRAAASAPRKPSSSAGVRPSRRARISSSLRTVRVISGGIRSLQCVCVGARTCLSGPAIWKRYPPHKSIGVLVADPGRPEARVGATGGEDGQCQGRF